jgi:hypothetical protein
MSDLSIYPEQLAEMSEAQLAALPAAQLVEVQRNLEQLQAWTKRTRARFDAALLRRFGDLERAARAEAARDFGIVHFRDGVLRVTADAPMCVTWDQQQLAAIARRIVACGERVEDYLDIELTVSESRYNNWSQALRRQFAPARTVEPGKTSFSLVLDVDGSDA